MQYCDDTALSFIIISLRVFVGHRRGRETVRRGRAAVQHAAVRQWTRPHRGAQAGADGERDGRGDAQPVAQRSGAAAVGHARRRGRARVRGRATGHHPSAVLRHVRPVVRAARDRVRGVLGRVRQTVPGAGRRRRQPQRQRVRGRQDGRARGRAAATTVSGKEISRWDGVRAPMRSARSRSQPFRGHSFYMSLGSDPGT